MSAGSRRWLRAAAAYNAVCGTTVVLTADAVAWKCVAMMVLCYAPGYWLAARRPLPELVAVGLLGKVLGPVGFAYAYATGALPLAFGLVVLANDVIWWPSFVRYLREMSPALRAVLSAQATSPQSRARGARPTAASRAGG
ncbi:MAG TPA: hypothetical protein VGJ77_16270 [Gaiellaceae bacterium]